MGSKVCGVQQTKLHDFKQEQIENSLHDKQDEQNAIPEDHNTPLHIWLQNNKLASEPINSFSNKPQIETTAGNKLIKEEQQQVENNKSALSQQKKSSKSLRSVKFIEQKNHSPIEINIENFIKCKKAKLSDKYLVIEQIGQGSFGNVYKAQTKCENNMQLRAVKTLKQKFMNHGDRRQFLAQLDLLKKLDHPNIIKLYQVLVWKNFYYVVMQFCQGGQVLKVIARKNNYSQYIIAIIMKQLLSAVAYINNKNIVHRDLKLQNMVFEKVLPNQSNNPSDFKIKIIDFGLAVDLRQYRKSKKQQLAGTKSYMPPQAFKGQCSFKTDSWSCGIILMLLLTGKNPFGVLRPNEIQNVNLMKGNSQIMIDNAWKNISHEARDLVEQLLQVDIKKRITAQKALKHSWIRKAIQNNKTSQVSDSSSKLVLNNLANFQRGDNFVAVIRSFITFKRVNQKQREQLAQLFQKFDKDGSGMIDKEELKDCYTQVVGQQNIQEIQQIIKEADYNNSGKIDFSEFMNAFCNKKQLFKMEALKQAFLYYDIDKNGYLSKNQLKQLLDGSPKAEVVEMFKAIDADSDNRISFREFAKYLQKH